jgi:putative DNA-binding protein
VTLAELQTAFHALATRAGDPAIAAERFLVGSAELSASERIGIYADMYVWRLTDSLREDHPKLATLLGDGRFLALAEAYAREHPSDQPDLGRFGRHLAAFLRRFPAPERPDLADLAALEWARSEVFLERPSTSVALDALAAVGPAEFVDARLEAIPALRVLVLEHDVVAVWGRLENGEPAGEPVARRCGVVVWRTELEVFHAPVDLDEARALDAAVAGEPLSRVCAELEHRDDPAAAAFAALSSWLEEGWIAAISTAEASATAATSSTGQVRDRRRRLRHPGAR